MYKRRITPKKRKVPLWPLIGLIFSVVLFIVGQLLIPEPETEDARQGSLDDFGFPTALENRAIPVLFGTNRLESPNVIWYGGLRAIAIIERVPAGGLFAGKKDVTVGYNYWLGFDLALCYGPIDSITEVRVGDKGILNSAGDSPNLPLGGWSDAGAAGGTDTNIDLPNQWGGFKHGGGLRGGLRLYNGNDVATPDPYVVSAVSDLTSKLYVPGYNGIARIVWLGGDIGESTNIRKWDMRIHRYPNSLGVIAPQQLINPNENGQGDANPICCLYEVLTNVSYGLGIPTNLIDITGFRAAATTIYDEGNGFSYMAQKSAAASTIVEEILRQVDGSIYQDTDGLMKIKLIREDFVVGDLPVFDGSNIVSIKKVAKMAWSDTQNSVHIDYVAREEEFKATIAVAHDMGNITMSGGQQNISKMKFPGVRTAGVAAAVAQRELATAATPLVSAAFDANRDAASLYPGDAIVVDLPEYGLDSEIMRVIEVNKGTVKNGKITVKTVQDVFGVATYTNFVGGGSSFHEDVSLLPDVASSEYVEGMTSWHTKYLSAVHSDTPGIRTVHRVQPPSGVTNSFYIASYDGTNYTIPGGNTGCTPASVTVSDDIGDNRLVRESDVYIAVGPNDLLGDPTPVISLGSDTSQILAAVSSQTQTDIQKYGYGLIQINNEVMAYESVSTEAAATGSHVQVERSGFNSGISETVYDYGSVVTGLNGVHRGLLDTDIEDHPYGSTIWFLSVSDYPVNDVDLSTLNNGVLTTRQFKHVMESPGGQTDLDDSTAVFCSSTEQARPLRPLRPANIGVNGSTGAAGHSVDLGTDDLDLTWLNHYAAEFMGDTEIPLQNDTGALSGTDVTVMKFQLQSENGHGTGAFTDISVNGVFTAGTGDTSFTITRAQLLTAAGWTGSTDSRNMRVVMTRQKVSGAGAEVDLSRAKPYREFQLLGD